MLEINVWPGMARRDSIDWTLLLSSLSIGQSLPAQSLWGAPTQGSDQDIPGEPPLSLLWLGSSCEGPRLSCVLNHRFFRALKMYCAQFRRRHSAILQTTNTNICLTGSLTDQDANPSWVSPSTSLSLWLAVSSHTAFVQWEQLLVLITEKEKKKFKDSHKVVRRAGELAWQLRALLHLQKTRLDSSSHVTAHNCL